MDALNDLIDGFKMDQGWNNDAVLELLKQFLWNNQDKWLNRSMLSDIDATFKEVASLENQDNNECGHKDHEDCLTCTCCGNCSESLNDDDICTECLEND